MRGEPPAEHDDRPGEQQGDQPGGVGGRREGPVLALVIRELRKTRRAIADIADRIRILTDIKGWFDFFNRFKRKKKEKD